MARTGCCSQACSCCKCIALAFPGWFYATLYVIFCLGCLGGGAFLVMFGLKFMQSTAGAFMSKEAPIGALALGGVLGILAIYGLIAPLGCCRGDQKSHLQLFYIFCIPVMITLLVFTAICLLNANDKDNLGNMLDYGWHKAFAKTADHRLITKAEADGVCCGFLSPTDRPVSPCPGGAKTGCINFLQKTMKVQLGFAGLLFGAIAGGIFLLMGITHGWIERLDQDDLKAAAQEGARAMSGASIDNIRATYGDGKGRGVFNRRQQKASSGGMPSQPVKNSGGAVGGEAQ